MAFRKILLVDHSETVLQMEQMILAQRPYDLITARDGEEGVAKAVESKPDLILMDVVMPNLNGFQATRTISKEETTKHIPIILVLWTLLISKLDASRMQSFLMLLAFGMALVIPCSWLFSQIFEQPFLKIRSFSQLGASLHQAAGRVMPRAAPVEATAAVSTELVADSGLSIEGAPPT